MALPKIMITTIDVSAAIYGTGVSDYTINLVEALLKINSDVKFKLFAANLRSMSKIKEIFPSSICVPVPPTLLEILWNQLHVLPIDLFVGKSDVVHSSDWTQPPGKSAKVTTIHDLSPFIYPTEMDKKIVDVHTRRMNWVVKECGRIICVSQNTANDLQRIFSVPTEKISVIYEALPKRFLLKPQLTKYTNYLVAIGARQPRKNIARLISAYLEYKQEYALPPKLIIIGENSAASSRADVVFTGYVNDQYLVDLLAGARALVYPSLYEGFGLPILGAFHHGVPVVASNTSSIPEIVGEAAVLVDPLDEKAIAKGIAQALATSDKLIEKGKKQLLNFSWEKAALETVKVYQSVC